MRSFSDIFKWYFSKSALPYWGVLLLDCFSVILSGLLSFSITRGFPELVNDFGGVFAALGLFLTCYLVTFRLFHTYDGIIRYSSFSDLQKVTSAVISATSLCCLLLLAWGMAGWHISFNYATVLLMGVFVILLMWVMRVWVKTLYESVEHLSDLGRCFVYGVVAGNVAQSRDLMASPGSLYRLAGYVSDDPGLASHMAAGVRVWRFDKHLAAAMKKKSAHVLLVYPQVADRLRECSDVVESLMNAGVRIMLAARPLEWDGKSDPLSGTMRPVNVEDLLPRDKIEVDMQAASSLLKDRVVMITGAAGSIGAEMVRQVAAYAPSRLVLVDQAETPMHDMRLEMSERWPGIAADTIVANIADEKYMERIFRTHRPDYVFHAAAYKHVPMMEGNPYEAVENNIRGTRILADLAVKYNTRKFVMVSTDKAVNPTNVMGCSKRICEIYVQSLDRAVKEGLVRGETQFVTTRFGNVLGSNGSVIPIFEEQIRKGGPVKVTHPDIIRYFMLISEACKLVIEAGTMGRGGEIYVFDMGKPVHIADLARKMIRLSGATGVEICYTGLREGEKLYEEVLDDKETTVPTFHRQIKVAKVREYGFDEVEKQISELINETGDSDDMQIVAMMKRIVPEYVSSNSRYQALDAGASGGQRGEK